MKLPWVFSVAVVVVLVMTISSGTAAATTPAAPPPGDIQHVVFIYLENAQRSSVLSHGPYEAYLAATYATDGNFFALCHPSAPNYLAVTSGRSLQCGSDSYHKYGDNNIANEFSTHGLSWMEYAESMPSPCDLNASGEYAVRHVPALFYADVVGNKPYCDSHVVNSAAFNSSIAAGTLANYSFYSPNLHNDGHTPGGTAGIANADTWLKHFLSPILNSSGKERVAVDHTVFFVVYDESASADTRGYSAGGVTMKGGNIYMVAVSPYSKGLRMTSDATEFNLLSTTEWLFSLPSTGGHDGTSAFPAMEGLFAF